MKTLISFATRWGPQFGGINSFNQDLLKAFAAAFYKHTRTICVVLYADEEEILEANNCQVYLVSLGLKDQKDFSENLAVSAWQALRDCEIENNQRETIWLGHDRVTGDVALKAAKEYGGLSALINHMSYDHYESFSENSCLATQKTKLQRDIFEKSDIVMAVGPLLRDALADMLDRPEIPMLVPGLPDIQVKNVFKTFRGFISGRLSEDSKKIKQGHLGVAAFSGAIQKADTNSGLPDILRGAREPELTIRGVDFEKSYSTDHANAEIALKIFAQKYAERAIRMHALPFTTDRKDLFNDLRSASVAMMPSWHEGFGLVGWEAISAGIPLIVSKKSGLYRLLEELDNGLYTSFVYPIDIAGNIEDPFFLDRDFEELSCLIIEVAKSHNQAREKALRLREELLKRYSWPNCARALAEILGWMPVAGTADLLPTLNPNLPEQEATTEGSSGGVLEMPSSTWRADAGVSNSVLLRAEEAVIPFDSDREPFLKEQLQWAQLTNYQVAIRLLTGVGGTGKTRLALELCLQLQNQGWHAGFLPNDAKAGSAVTNLIKSDRPICLVIDYAETRQQQLLELIKALLVAKVRTQIRIVLLARDSGEWWSLLPAKDSACQALLEGMATTGPYPLPQLHDSYESRQAAYRCAIAAFAQKLSLPEKPGMPNLEDDHFGHPLYVQMAALLALYGEHPGSAEAVARSLICHERRYWEKAMSALPNMAIQWDESAALLMALATLANYLPTVHDCETLWVSARQEKHMFKFLFPILARLYPGRQGVQGLRPDLLGEALVAQCLLGANGKALLEAVLGSKQATFRRAGLTVLARLLRSREELSYIIEPVLTDHFVTCADDLVAVIVETPSPLSRIAESAFANQPLPKKSQACGILSKHLKDEIIPLLDLAVLVDRAQLAKFERKTGKIADKDQANIAATLNNLSVSLVWQGHVQEAAYQAERALEIYEKLARAKPEHFEKDWAMSLSNYAGCLNDLGRSEEAEAKAKQALAIYERLAHAEPERFEQNLAGSLSNYANYANDLGRSEEAEIKARQALKIYEELARTKPESFEQDWAMSLCNYANHLNDLGRSEEAEAKARQALEIYEKLARAKPERFEQDWARSLSNYATRLSDLGRSEEAEAKVKQALAIYEKLARAKPERFERDWAMSLNNYANYLRDLGRNKEAEAKAKQALEIYEKLARAKPERFEQDWAASLENHAICLSDLGRSEEAEVKARQALDIYEKLADAKPLRFEYDFISSAMFAAQCSWLAGNEQALATEYPIPCYSTPRQQRMLNYQRSFLTAFSTKDPTYIREAIIKAEACWATMDASQKRTGEIYALLLAGLAESLLISSVLTCNWRENLARFLAKREGRVPSWMQKFADRSGFSLRLTSER